MGMGRALLVLLAAVICRHALASSLSPCSIDLCSEVSQLRREVQALKAAFDRLASMKEDVSNIPLTQQPRKRELELPRASPSASPSASPTPHRPTLEFRHPDAAILFAGGSSIHGVNDSVVLSSLTVEGSISLSDPAPIIQPAEHTNPTGSSLSVVSGVGATTSGPLSLLSASAASGTETGSVLLASGSAGSSRSGSVTVQTGSALSHAGTLSLVAGSSAAIDAEGGSVVLQAGSGQAAGGSVEITTGASSSGSSGDLTLATGVGPTSGSIDIHPGLSSLGNGADVYVTGGQATASVGGSLVLAGGSSGLGRHGLIRTQSPVVPTPRVIATTASILPIEPTHEVYLVNVTAATGRHTVKFSVPELTPDPTGQRLTVVRVGRGTGVNVRFESVDSVFEWSVNLDASYAYTSVLWLIDRWIAL